MSTISASTTTTTGYVVTSDSTGTLVFQTGATPTTALTIGSDQSVTFAGAVNTTGNQTVTGNLAVTGSLTTTGYANLPNTFGFKNRLINGRMEVDQRNLGVAVANSSNWTTDRWGDFCAGSGKYSAQQVTTAPTGFINSLLHTVTTSVTAASGDVYQIFQAIEGLNVTDLAWGTANAQPVTISFWVRASITGTYPVAIKSYSGSSRSYVATYTISAANTFEYKTVTIPGVQTERGTQTITVFVTLRLILAQEAIRTLQRALGKLAITVELPLV